MMQTIKDLEFFGGSLSSSNNSTAFAGAYSFFKENGGGTLHIGSGVWRTGPIELCSNMTLELGEGAILSFVPEMELYQPVKTRWEGVVCYAMHPCIFATGQEHITICGEGIIDGSGHDWWKLVPEKQKQRGPVLPIEKSLAALNPGYEKQPGGGGGRNSQFLRPPLVQFHECSDVSIRGVRLQNSPFWTLHPLFCDKVCIAGVTIYNPADAPNTDGIDIDSCTNVVVDSCRVNVGDDGIAVKSGSGEDGLKVARPSKDICIKNCFVGNGHGGVTLGSEIAGGVENVTVDSCSFMETDRGIRIKTRRGRGGRINNIILENLMMERNLCPIAVNMFYRCGSDPLGKDRELFSTEALPVTETTPSITNIRASRINATNCRASAGFIAALPESKLTGFVLKDSCFTIDGNDKSPASLSEMYAGIGDAPGKSFRILNAENPEFVNVTMDGIDEKFLFK